MLTESTPLLWPEVWNPHSVAGLIGGTGLGPIVCSDKTVSRQLAEAGHYVVNPHDPPKGVTILEGSVAGIKLAGFGSSTAVSSGPTGEPWVNSNLWPVRLARARNPENAVWVRTQAPDNTSGAAFPYLIMMADAALTGGRWVIALDAPLARAIGDGKPAALDTWKKITSAATYFADRHSFDSFVPEAVIAIVSDFGTSFEHEVLNLVTRSGQQYRVIPQERLTATSLAGLRAVLAPGAEAPPPPIRANLLNFVQRGGMLITAIAWDKLPNSSPAGETHPRFTITSMGKGTVIEPKQPMRDPYVLANDAAILVSHRYDLLRFWNGGAMSAYYSSTSDRSRGLVQILFYSNRPSDDVAVRIAGKWRAASLSTLEKPNSAPVHFEQQNSAIEVHLPAVDQYAAIELEA